MSAYRPKRRLSIESLEPRRVLATFIVNTDADEPVAGPTAAMAGSLRQMIENAEDNADGTVDAIVFDATVFPIDGVMDTITLTEGDLLITDAVTITGPGWDELTIDASGIGDPRVHGDGIRVVTTERLF